MNNDYSNILVEEGQDSGEISNMKKSPSIASTATEISPQRKISSSRLISAFTQLYSSTTSNHTCSPSSSSPAGCSSTTNDDDNLLSNSSGRTPTRGMESKIMTMLNNIKYGWSSKMRPTFSKEQPVWLLGRHYHRKSTPPNSMENSGEYFLTGNNLENITIAVPPDGIAIQEYGMDAVTENENSWESENGIEGFKRDFQSRLWLTYRREFPTMNGSNYTSDCGWGCMLRSGQMLLAQGLICHFLDRCWRWDPETQLHSTHEDNIHRKIIRWFGDSSSKSHPFSIHTLVGLGENMGKKAGDWYGPSMVSHLLRQAVNQAKQEIADFDDLVVYVAQDCTIYIQDILDEALVSKKTSTPNLPWQQNLRKKSTNNSPQQPVSDMHWKSVVILVPLRLGAERLNPIYAHCLKSLLNVEYCIGIIGGRPKHSLYFVGYQDDKLIHLDPHYCQDAVDVNQENFSVHSFHCRAPRKLKSTKIDPSCCVGFYCQTKKDFDNLIKAVQPYLHPMKYAKNFENDGSPTMGGNNDINYPMFVFSRGRNSDHIKDEPSESVYKPMQLELSRLQQELCDNNEDENDETEEFVIL